MPSKEAARRIGELRRTRRGARAPLLGRPAHDRAAARRARPGVGPRRRPEDDRRPDAARPARARGARAHGAARGEQREPQRRSHALDLRRGRGGVRRRGRGLPLRAGTARRLGLDRRRPRARRAGRGPRRRGVGARRSPMRCETSATSRVPRARCRLATPMARVLVVCTGNVCRSPIAEGLPARRIRGADGARRARGHVRGNDGVDRFGRRPDARSRRPPSAGSTSRAIVRAATRSRRGRSCDADPRDGERARGRRESRAALRPVRGRSRSRSSSGWWRRSPAERRGRDPDRGRVSRRRRSFDARGFAGNPHDEDIADPLGHAARSVPGELRGSSTRGALGSPTGSSAARMRAAATGSAGA